MVLYRDEILFGMHNRQHVLVYFSKLFGEWAITCQYLFGAEEHGVLTIKYSNIRVTPYSLTYGIYRHKTHVVSVLSRVRHYKVYNYLVVKWFLLAFRRCRKRHPQVCKCIPCLPLGSSSGDTIGKGESPRGEEQEDAKDPTSSSAARWERRTSGAQSGTKFFCAANRYRRSRSSRCSCTTAIHKSNVVSTSWTADLEKQCIFFPFRYERYAGVDSK